MAGRPRAAKKNVALTRARKATSRRSTSPFATLAGAPPEALPGLLVDAFGCLADSPGFDTLLAAVMEKATSARVEDGKAFVTLGDLELVFFPPRKPPAGLAPAFARLAKVFSLVRANRIPSHGPGYALESIPTEPVEQEWLDGTELEGCDDVARFFTDYADVWIVHPANSIAAGEPVLCLLSHEGKGLEPSEFGRLQA
jgi:hypothetical protein